MTSDPGRDARTKRKVTTRSLRELKQRGEPISALTAYDFLTAQLLDRAGVDVILVGDSAGMVVQGLDTTVGVTLEQMLYHSTVVARGVERALVVADMPFMSYQVNPDEALRNAGRMIKETGVEAVKLEGGQALCPTIRRIVDVGIPVMGHLGLTPQSIHKFGTYQVRATEPEEAEEVRRDALALEHAGVFSIVIEKVPAALAEEVARSVSVPVIGIGAGAGVDGQILVLYDIIGLTSGRKPRFVRDYSAETRNPLEAVRAYVGSVKDGSYPAPEHCFS